MPPSLPFVDKVRSRMNDRKELEHFKRLDLRQYAASLGYEIDQRESSRREAVMRRSDDKISIRLFTDNHYVFYSLPGRTR